MKVCSTSAEPVQQLMKIFFLNSCMIYIHFVIREVQIAENKWL